MKCRDLYTIMEIRFKSRDLYMHREIITCIGKLLLRSSISYFIWQDLIDNLYIYIYIYRCLYIYRFFTDGYVYIYAIELRKIGCLFSFSYVSTAIVHL